MDTSVGPAGDARRAGARSADAAVQYHNANAAPPSLFRDYACGEEQLPTRAALTLDAHNDEVWSLAFDHTGTRLATASRDGTVILWEVLARGARARAHETARLDVCEDVCLDGERVIKNRAAWYLSRPERGEDQGEGTARDCRGTADVDAAAEPEPPPSSSDSRSRTFDAEDDEEAFEEEFEYEASDFPPDSDFLPLTHVAWSHDASRVVTCGGGASRRFGAPERARSSRCSITPRSTRTGIRTGVPIPS